MLRLTLCCLGLLGATPAGPARTTAPDLADYEAARARFGPGSDDQVRLALWCESRGLAAERDRHLARAVLTDPKNATARGLLGLVEDGRGRWRRPGEASGRGDEAAALAEYAARRDRTPDTAQAHWDLALWCEKQGLRPEAVAHLTTVTRLDPTRVAAWKHLGLRLHGGRWLTPERVAAEKAEADAQARADRQWRPRLERLRESISARDRSRRASAEAGLNAITDPRAVPALVAVFGAGDPALGRRAVQVLGRIDAPSSSRALADLAVTAPADAVRRAAIETLRRRDPREFVDRLIARLDDPIGYHVRPVGGPGDPGELVVHGPGFDLDRVYSPPPLPVVPLSPGSTLDRDDNGQLVVHVANAVPGFAVLNSLTPPITWAMIERTLEPENIRSTPNPPGQWMLQNRGPRGADQVARVVEAFLGANSGLLAVPFILNPRAMWVASPEGVQTQEPLAGNPSVQTVNTSGRRALPQPPIAVPVGRMVTEIHKAAYMARGQQRDDAATLDRHNAAVRTANDRVLVALAAVLGTTPGATRSDARRWWTEQRGYALKATPLAARTGVVEDVALDYTPQPVGRFLYDRRVGYYTPPSGSCFAAGTPVRTPGGLAAIEAVKVGDRVLAQDPRSGALSYQPVVAVFHNAPAPTLKIALSAGPIDGAGAVAVTGIHRFWKAGTGWVMARDLKPGDAVRTLGGVARVATVDSGETLPVFNLEVAGGHDFFAGDAGALVHDHTVVEPVDRPFDAPPAVALAGRSD